MKGTRYLWVILALVLGLAFMPSSNSEMVRIDCGSDCVNKCNRQCGTDDKCYSDCLYDCLQDCLEEPPPPLPEPKPEPAPEPGSTPEPAPEPGSTEEQCFIPELMELNSVASNSKPVWIGTDLCCYDTAGHLKGKCPEGYPYYKDGKNECYKYLDDCTKAGIGFCYTCGNCANGD